MTSSQVLQQEKQSIEQNTILAYYTLHTNNVNFNLSLLRLV